MSNPMFREGIYQEAVVDGGQMTINGSIAKTASLLLFALASAMFTWSLGVAGMTDKLNMFIWGGIIVGFISVIVCSFKHHLSGIFAPVYAIAEGLALGGISYAYNAFYEGIVIQAVAATMITLGVMLTLYSTKLIQATEKFKRIVATATLSIGIFYLLVIIASVFRIQFLSPFIGAYNNVFDMLCNCYCGIKFDQRF